MRKLFILLSIVFNITLFSQKDIQFGIDNFGANRILNFQNSGFDDETQATIRDLEIFKYGVGVSFTVQKELNELWSIRTGFNYRFTGWQTKRYTNFVRQIGGVVENSVPKKDFYHIHQAILPIDFHYHCFASENRYLLAGFRLIYTPHFSSQRNFGKRGSRIVSYESNQREDFPMFNASLRFGMGYKKSLNKRMDIWIEPYMEYYFFSYDTFFADKVDRYQASGALRDYTVTNSYLSISRGESGVRGQLYQIGVHTYIQIKKRK